MKQRKKTVIIGAGPAGLVAAFELLKNDHEVEVFEASPFVGGLCRSLDLWDQRVDLGPHRFFSGDARVNQYWKNLLTDDLVWVKRKTRIRYNNRMFEYPLQIINVLSNLSIWDTTLSIFSYALTRFKKNREIENFEDWVVSRFGRRLFSIFFKSYTEKVWGLSCRAISKQWAEQRIRGFSLFKAIQMAFTGFSRKRPRTLVDYFSYPKNGAGSVYQKLAKKIENHGGKIHLCSPVKRVLTKAFEGTEVACGVELENGSVVLADCVVSTMPISTMVLALPALPVPVREASERLRFRNTILVYLEIDDPHIFEDQWIYIHSPELQHGRITNFRNWSPFLYGDSLSTILCMEFWSFPEDPIWKMSSQEISEIASRELMATELLKKKSKILNIEIVKLSKSYPVYDLDFETNLKLIFDHVTKIKNLFPIGRNGSFKYNNQDHSILMGLLIPEAIELGFASQILETNTGDEYFENARAEI